MLECWNAELMLDRLIDAERSRGDRGYLWRWSLLVSKREESPALGSVAVRRRFEIWLGSGLKPFRASEVFLDTLDLTRMRGLEGLGWLLRMGCRWWVDWLGGISR